MSTSYSKSLSSFDPEIGEVTRFADSLENWAEQILKNARVETAWPLSQQWLQEQGSLPANRRLCPKRLFIMGGSFTLDRLFAVDAVEGMRFRGDIARQIRDLPDGTKVRIVVGEGAYSYRLGTSPAVRSDPQH